jgi:hypothetical protein
MAEKQLQEIELKEKLGLDQFTQMMRQCLEAIEGDEDMTLTVAGRPCNIPAGFAQKAKLEVEYELKKGEYELEFTIKYRS